MKTSPSNRRSVAAAKRKRPTTAVGPSVHATKLSHADLVHELEVHQVELEMQNDQLRQAQLDLAAARDRFVDLYDFAPVGYFTLDIQGMITEANLTGATMLGIGRKHLLGRGFSRSLVPAHATIWHQHMRQAMLQEGTKRIELVLQRASGETFHGQLDCALFAPHSQLAGLRVTLTDITQRKLAEMDRRIADGAQDAREAERRQVARELHEGLGQRLSALKMELVSLPLTSDPLSSARERVNAMLETLDDAMASVRRIAIELRPLMLDDLGLTAAIDWLARDVGRRLGLDIRLDLQDIDPAPDERTSIAMYRMAQEILDHIAHRGKSTDVSVSLVQEGRDLILSVACQGRRRQDGFADESDDEASCAPSDDLTQSLLNRARLLGGRLTVGDDAELGPSITVHIPLMHQGATTLHDRDTR